MPPWSGRSSTGCPTAADTGTPTGTGARPTRPTPSGRTRPTGAPSDGRRIRTPRPPRGPPTEQAYPRRRLSPLKTRLPSRTTSAFGRRRRAAWRRSIGRVDPAAPEVRRLLPLLATAVGALIVIAVAAAAVEAFRAARSGSHA